MKSNAVGIASESVLDFNQIIARTVDSLEAAVTSGTQFNADHTTSVLPETATLTGTTRALSFALQDHCEVRMPVFCEGAIAANGVKAMMKHQRLYPPTANHPKESEFTEHAAAWGAGTVPHVEPPVTVAEDFAWMLLEKTGSSIWIGNGREHQDGCMLHNPGYDFNDRVLQIGSGSGWNWPIAGFPLTTGALMR